MTASGCNYVCSLVLRRGLTAAHPPLALAGASSRCRSINYVNPSLCEQWKYEILVAFGKFRRTTVSSANHVVRPPVRPSVPMEQLGPNWKNFSGILK
jgi:hypothetical protein